MRLLVTGGAGYIGSHMCRMLAAHGHEVGVIDNLSTGYRAAVRWGPLFVGDLRSAEFLAQVFERFAPQGVLHFAARSQVGESVAAPADYYSNNVLGTLSLLEQVRKIAGCLFVFSSTAAIFGEPQTPLIDELHPCAPINPYGRGKLAIEFALRDYFTAYQMPSISFRYFNAAGADESGEVGEAHLPETHLIPRLLETAAGRAESVTVFGDDYATADGTCIRDYVHVNDLCSAHLLGIDYLRQNPGAHFFNLGNGDGFSVREVIGVTEQVIGRRLAIQQGARRAGDPPRLVADARRAIAELGWRPRFAALPQIVSSAWAWHRGGPLPDWQRS